MKEEAWPVLCLPLSCRLSPRGTHQGAGVLRAVFGPVLCQPLLLFVKWLGFENHLLKFKCGVTVQSPFLRGTGRSGWSGSHQLLSFSSPTQSCSHWSSGDPLPPQGTWPHVLFCLLPSLAYSHRPSQGGPTLSPFLVSLLFMIFTGAWVPFSNLIVSQVILSHRHSLVIVLPNASRVTIQD